MAALQRARMSAAQAVYVVPAVRIERVHHHGRAEQEAHLAARHADLDLIDLLGIEQVALLHVHAIDAAGGGGGENDCGKAKDHGSHEGKSWRIMAGIIAESPRDAAGAHRWKPATCARRASRSRCRESGSSRSSPRAMVATCRPKTSIGRCWTRARISASRRFTAC